MIRIQNIYYMLTYAFQVLKGKGYRNIELEEFENTGDLCAEILIKSLNMQLKRGLQREYISKKEPLSCVKGKIDISDSIKTQSLYKNQLVCSYDDFSLNSYMNRILRSTLELLLHSEIAAERKRQIKNILIFFKDVEPVDLRSADWKIYFNRNNETYRMLMGICYLAAKGLLQTQSDGKSRLMDFLDEQRMSRLYEKFILEYYKKHYPSLHAGSSFIPWVLDDTEDDMLPVMHSDVSLQDGSTVLIIDAKYYDKNTQVRFDHRTIHSGNLYQIFTYVKNCDYAFGEKSHSVSGMLLYAKTEEQMQPDNVYKMHGNQIAVKTLDLNADFSHISFKLDSIVQEHFKGIQKCR